MKKFLIFLVVVIAGIQFIPVEQTNPPVENDLFASNEVKDILKRACYDCHSNETNWVWYTKIAPMSWLAAGDVNGGRESLNFSEWGNISTMDQKIIKEKIWEQVREEQMPLWQYRIMDGNSKISIEEKNIIRAWTTN